MVKKGQKSSTFISRFSCADALRLVRLVLQVFGLILCLDQQVLGPGGDDGEEEGGHSGDEKEAPGHTRTLIRAIL